MSDYVNGVKVNNTRTGDTGTCQGTKKVWNGRSYTRKVLVLLQGDTKPKLWAMSSCNIVEQQAPRALVKLKELVTFAKANKATIQTYLDAKYIKTEYTEQSEMGAFKSISSGDYIDCELDSQSGFFDLNLRGFGEVILFVTSLYDWYSTQNYISELGECGTGQELITELCHLYSGKLAE